MLPSPRPAACQSPETLEVLHMAVRDGGGRGSTSSRSVLMPCATLLAGCVRNCPMQKRGGGQGCCCGGGRTLGVFHTQVAVADLCALEALRKREPCGVRRAAAGAGALAAAREVRHERTERQLLVAAAVLVEVLVDDGLAGACEGGRGEQRERQHTQQDRGHAGRLAMTPASTQHGHVGWSGRMRWFGRAAFPRGGFAGSMQPWLQGQSPQQGFITAGTWGQHITVWVGSGHLRTDAEVGRPGPVCMCGG